MQHTVLATGLKFPEGPIAMDDGSVVLVEIARGTLSRVKDGSVDVIADLGGGPNGAAIGPDGKCYVCNNGGFQWIERDGRLYPGEQPDDYTSGRIERVDLETGEFEVLYSECDGRPLCGPNDIVFDASGGFWFTDHGKTRARDRDRTGVFYAASDGSSITEVIFPMEGPNGIGLSAAEDELYVAETVPGPTERRLWAFALDGPGQLKDRATASAGYRATGRPSRLPSVRFAGGGCRRRRSVSPPSSTAASPRSIRMAQSLVLCPCRTVIDRLTTNICFGGRRDLNGAGCCTAYHHAVRHQAVSWSDSCRGLLTHTAIGAIAAAQLSVIGHVISVQSTSADVVLAFMAGLGSHKLAPATLLYEGYPIARIAGVIMRRPFGPRPGRAEGTLTSRSI